MKTICLFFDCNLCSNVPYLRVVYLSVLTMKKMILNEVGDIMENIEAVIFELIVHSGNARGMLLKRWMQQKQTIMSNR